MDEAQGNELRIVYRALPAHRRREIWVTAGLLALSAFVEVMSIGAILPFLALLTDPETMRGLPLIGGWLAGLTPGPALVGTAAAIFIALAIASAALRLALSRASQALAFNIARDLSVLSFGKLLRQEYPFYVARHSGDLLGIFEKLHYLSFSVFLSGIQALVATIIGVLLIAVLVAVTSPLAVAAAGLLVAAYVAASVVARPRLIRNADALSAQMTQRIKLVQVALGGIRDILLDRSRQVFEEEFKSSADLARRAFISNAFLGIAPRVLIETLGIILIGLYAWYLSAQPGGLVAAVPMLGALALGAQRLMPQMQQAYAGWSNYMGGRTSLREVAQILTLPVPPEDGDAAPEGPAFAESLRFEHVGFAYPGGAPVLHGIDLMIRPGERVGIAGTTGAGKSTLMDLLLGLLEPGEGRITVDGEPLDHARRVRWQAAIAHVPQAIYLTDDSLAANIAFGVPEAKRNMDRVRHAARRAEIAGFIESLQQGYDTKAGERGVRLSGGQRQRIGIARALYKKASVLVLDEATSALDSKTEGEVMRSIEALGEDITVIMIAHRASTLERCDRVIRIEDGRIASVEERKG